MIVILAQCGSYVPAQQASIPIRHQLCCRIGNTDDQEHNLSTFLLEMKETAFLCNTATEKSLVLVDELGRATSNEDGVALAWATAEYLLKRRALTFFVTHYPQLCRLADTYPQGVQNVHMGARIMDAPGEIRYTHKLQAGSCAVTNQYGVELAAACGWPQEVVQRAMEVQSHVQNLLPDDRLCEDRPSEANRAFQIVKDMDDKLQQLLSGTEMLSISDIRQKLHTLQQIALHGAGGPRSSKRAVDRLLFPERRSCDNDDGMDSSLSSSGSSSSSDDDNSSISSSSSSSSDDSEVKV